jgi:hypothetical protein
MKSKESLVLGNVYAVQTGAYAGEMLVYIKSTGTSHCFLAVPTMINRNVPIESFDTGRNTDIIKFVEKVPVYVAEVSKAQYIQNENLNN